MRREKVMNKDRCRSIGAIAGLAIGFGLMYLLGLSGIVPGALFGAGGAVTGGIVGEQIHARTRA